MSMRDEIADILWHIGTRGGVSCNEKADAIMDALPSMVVPLVWDGVEDDCFISCDMGTHSYELLVVDTLERSCDYSWGAVYDPSGSRAINIPTPAQATLDDARAAANAHHVAAVMAAFGEVM